MTHPARFDYDPGQIPLRNLARIKNASEFNARWNITAGPLEENQYVIMDADDGAVLPFRIGVLVKINRIGTLLKRPEPTTAEVLWQDAIPRHTLSVVHIMQQNLWVIRPRHQGVLCEASPYCCGVCGIECGGECAQALRECAPDSTYEYEPRIAMPDYNFTPLQDKIKIGGAVLTRQTFDRLTAALTLPELARILDATPEEVCLLILLGLE